MTMAYTTKDAFTLFRSQEVDLTADITKTARTSRDFLLRQIESTAKDNASFPTLYGGYVSFGSFARSTKTQPLDDIDLLLPLNGKSTEATVSSNDPYTYWLRLKDRTVPLASFPDNSGYVNSTKVLNSIKSGLSDVRKYKKADIKKNMEAVTLSLPSYDWVFDIVPAVPIGDSSGAIAYYLIPNGTGDWKRTDPRIDETNCSRVDARHGKLFRPTVRVLKYWNKRPIAPALPSYYLETLALKVFSTLSVISLVRVGVERFFYNVGPQLWATCPDPKGLGPPLDSDITVETKTKVAQAFTEAAKSCGYALMYEQQNDHKKAIYWWRQVFGERFTDYG
jgi:hypothetical protein